MRKKYKYGKTNCRAVPLTAGIIGESDAPFSPECVLPEQFFSLSDLEQPEKKLMLAMLQDAIHCLSYFFAKTIRERCLAQEAKEWIESSDTFLPFTFVRVCEALGLDPDYVRRKSLAALPQK